MTTNLTTEEFDAQVVAGSGSLTWTRSDLHKLFDKVTPAWRGAGFANWKDPINVIVPVESDWELFGIREAIIFFTGSVPTLTARPRGRYVVKAAGYYATVGA